MQLSLGTRSRLTHLIQGGIPRRGKTLVPRVLPLLAVLLVAAVAHATPARAASLAGYCAGVTCFRLSATMADGSAVPRSVPPADEGDETKPAAPLGGLDLWSYCNAIGYNGYVLTGANAYSYSCKDWSGGLHGLNNMDAPCNWQYHRGDVLSRFSTFYSTTSWQCYGSAGILGGIDFASYCKEHEGEGYTTQNNAYSVACTTESGGTFGINFDEACQSQYDQDAALSRVINFYDPNGWQCFITKP